MVEKARHAFGQSSGIEAAKQANKIDSFDILFLDGDTEPKVGWLDAQGVTRIAQGKKQIVRVNELPIENGDENVVYVFNNEGYIWDSVNSQCVSLSKSADLTALENQVANLETQMGDKVDEATIDSKIEAAVEAAVAEASGGEVVEF